MVNVLLIGVVAVVIVLLILGALDRWNVFGDDREYIWRGLRFVGLGYDPDLVAECYEELVPNTLVEHELTIRPPDSDRQVTAVRARTETPPPDVAQPRATFSDRFPIRKTPDRHNLPTVEPEELTRVFQIPTGE